MANPYRVLARSADEPTDAPLEVFRPGPSHCPFCLCPRVRPSLFWFKERIVGRWDPGRACVRERCRECNGRWLTMPKKKQGDGE